MNSNESESQLLLCSETFTPPTPPRDDTGWVKPASSIIWSLSESKSQTTLRNVNNCLTELSDDLLTKKHDNAKITSSAINSQEQIPKDHLLKTALLGGALSHGDLYSSATQKLYSESPSKCADVDQKSVGNEEETRRRMSGTNGFDRSRMTGSASAGGEENLSRISDGVTSQGPHQPQTAEGMLVSRLGSGAAGALALHDPGARSIVAGTAGAGPLAGVNRGVFRPPQTVAEQVGRYTTIYSSAGSSSTLSPYSPLYSSHGQGQALSFYNSQYTGYSLQGHYPAVESYSAVLQNLGNHAAQSQVQQIPYSRGSLGGSVGQYSYLSSRTNSDSPGPSKSFSQSTTSSLREREELELKMRREHEIELQRRHSTGFLKEEKSHHFSVPYSEASRMSLSSALRESPKLKHDMPLSAQDIYKVPSGREGSLKHRLLRPSDSTSAVSVGSVRHSAFSNTDEPSPKRTKPNGIEPSHVVINQESNIPGSVPQADTKLPGPAPLRDVSAAGNHSHLQYPQHFMRGSIIQLANNELKRVEDLETEDFVQSADISSDLKIDSCTVVKIEEDPSQGTAVLGFVVGEHKVMVKVVATLEHPFFVFGRGWSSCEPDRTIQRFGLQCKPLIVGDVCVSLTHKDVAKHAAEISKQQQQSGTSDFQPVKSEPCSDMGEGQLRKSPGHSQGQGSHVQGQDQRSGVNPPQCVGQKEERSSSSVTSTSQVTYPQAQEHSSPGS